jgi:outer membrane immunogenic protein
MFIRSTIAALLTATAVAAVTPVTSASAADLPRPYSKAPAYVGPGYYDWTGFYAGINGGYGWANNSGPKGFIGGGQLGYNWQTGNFVFGLEGDIQYSAMKLDEDLGGGVTGTSKVEAFGTARGRIGYAFDRALVYGTGGFAYTKTKISLSGPGGSISDSKWSSGYALGGGLEYALWDRWTAKAEYLYIHSGDVTLTLGGVTATGNYNYNVARAGLNYRF